LIRLGVKMAMLGIIIGQKQRMRVRRPHNLMVQMFAKILRIAII